MKYVVLPVLHMRQLRTIRQENDFGADEWKGKLGFQSKSDSTDRAPNRYATLT